MQPGWPKRRSLAIARIAPAPAQTPSTAAMIGCGQARIARTRSPVMRVKSSSPSRSILVSGPMISWTSPPEQKLPPAPRMHHDLDRRHLLERVERVAQLVIAVEGQRVLALGPVERDRRDAVLELPQEMRRARKSPGRSSRAGAPVDGDRGAVDVAAKRQAQHGDDVADRLRVDQPPARIHVGDRRARIAFAAAGDLATRARPTGRSSACRHSRGRPRSR